MDLSFPDELLGSSMLVPISASPNNQYEGRGLLKPVNTPEPSRTTRPASVSEFPSALRLSNEKSALPKRRAISPTQSSSFYSCTSSNPRIRAVQLELEKERELYAMHTSAAVKCFERINRLMNDLSSLLENISFENNTSEGYSITSPTPQSIKQHDHLPRSRELNDTHSTSLSNMTPGKQTTSYQEALPAAHKNTKGMIRDVSVAVKSKFFSRKPRCLLFARADDDDLLITSSLDGSIQYNSAQRQTTTRSIFLPSHLKKPCFPESICPLTLLDGFVVSASDASTSNGNFETDSSNLSSSLIFFPCKQDPEPTPVILTARNSPHQKAISTLAPLHESVFSNRTRFLSGGIDKNVTIWELDLQLSATSAKEIHKCHTSVVHSITQVASSPNIIWSGGADCRLISWCLKESRQTFAHRYEHRISHLLTNPNHPNSIIVTFCSRTAQLRLIDHRGPLGQGFRAFGHAEMSSASRYMRPGWSQDGNLVAFGTSSPESRVSALNIWDLRYMNEAASPVRSIEFNGEKRILGCEFSPMSNMIVAVATDNSANFVDFTTS